MGMLKLYGRLQSNQKYTLGLGLNLKYFRKESGKINA